MINCGDILDGVTIEQKGEEIFRAVPESRSASAPSRRLGYGDLEFVPQTGAVMRIKQKLFQID